MTQNVQASPVFRRTVRFERAVSAKPRAHDQTEANRQKDANLGRSDPSSEKKRGE
jgi:hypothetical protein